MKGIKFKKHNEDYYSRPLYEVGDLYITTKSENPSSRFGGTWELYGPGRTLVCVDISQTEFNTVKRIGGVKTHVHDLNNATANIRNWQGKIVFSQKASAESWTEQFSTNQMLVDSTDSNSYGVGLSGNTDASSSLQPFITCYVWIRTA